MRFAVTELLLLGAIACGGGDAEPADAADAGAPLTPSPYTFDDVPGEGEAPPLAAEQVAAGIAAGLAVSITLDLQPLFDLYVALLDEADGGGCPFVASVDREGGSDLYWQGDCATAGGARFSGYGSYGTFTGLDYGDGVLYSGWSAYHAGRIESASGVTLDGSGGAYDSAGEGAEARARYRSLDGTFVVTGADGTSAWFDGSRSPSFQVGQWWAPDGAGGSIGLTGGVAGLPGNVDTIAFSEVTFVQAEAGSPCALEPGGTVSARVAGGDWYDVIFDGPLGDDWKVLPAECDGCGRGYFRGREIGAICVDFAALSGWGVNTW